MRRSAPTAPCLTRRFPRPQFRTHPETVAGSGSGGPSTKKRRGCQSPCRAAACGSVAVGMGRSGLTGHVVEVPGCTRVDPVRGGVQTFTRRSPGADHPAGRNHRCPQPPAGLMPSAVPLPSAAVTQCLGLSLAARPTADHALPPNATDDQPPGGLVVIYWSPRLHACCSWYKHRTYRSLIWDQSPFDSVAARVSTLHVGPHVLTTCRDRYDMVDDRRVRVRVGLGGRRRLTADPTDESVALEDFLSREVLG